LRKNKETRDRLVTGVKQLDILEKLDCEPHNGSTPGNITHIPLSLREEPKKK
jgi:hypothetical protein